MKKEANWIFFDAGIFIGAFDVEDWQVFEPDGIMIVVPQSILSKNKS